MHFVGIKVKAAVKPNIVTLEGTTIKEVWKTIVTSPAFALLLTGCVNKSSVHYYLP